MKHPETKIGTLLDRIKEQNGIHYDAELSREIGVSQAAISSLRAKRINPGNAIIVKLCERFKLSVKAVRAELKED